MAEKTPNPPAADPTTAHEPGWLPAGTPSAIAAAHFHRVQMENNADHFTYERMEALYASIRANGSAGTAINMFRSGAVSAEPIGAVDYGLPGLGLRIQMRAAQDLAALSIQGHPPTVMLEPPASSIIVPDVALLMQSQVVQLGAKTTQGDLIELVTVPWFQIIEELIKDPQFAYQMSPRMWEEMVAGIYDRSGFEEVILTPRSGDGGRDVIAIKHGVGSIRVIDQVKAYGPGHLVTADDVRALYGVLEMDNAAMGFLTTTSDFAPRLKQDELIKPWIGKKLGLVNGVELVARLQELARK